jgi:hypothetical protein
MLHFDVLMALQATAIQHGDSFCMGLHVLGNWHDQLTFLRITPLEHEKSPDLGCLLHPYSCPELSSLWMTQASSFYPQLLKEIRLGSA